MWATLGRGFGLVQRTGVGRLGWSRGCSGPAILPHSAARFGGVNIEVDGVSDSTFASGIGPSTRQWAQQGKKACWLHLPVHRARLAEIAAEDGFQLHHAEGDQLALVRWLPDGPSQVPQFGTHQVGVAGFVLSEDGDSVLVVSESHYNSRWKLPGGLAEAGEEIPDTALREVEEETGVKADRGTATRKLVPQKGEIEACKWIQLSEAAAAFNHPLQSAVVREILTHGGERAFVETTMTSVTKATKTFAFYHPDPHAAA